MTYQYMIWRYPDGSMEHLAFNQRTMRIVYPPSHKLYRGPVQTAINLYEGKGWKLIKQGAWRGDKIDEYLEAMRTMYPKALQEETTPGERKPFKFSVSKKDTSSARLPDDGDST